MCDCKVVLTTGKNKKEINFSLLVSFKDKTYNCYKTGNRFEIYSSWNSKIDHLITTSTYYTYDTQYLYDNLNEPIYCNCYEPQIIMTIAQAIDLEYLCTHVPEAAEKYLLESIGFKEIS